jgi:hypothetical protein
MLNSILIEQFAAIHRQRQTGVLTVAGPEYRLRFCMQGGDPVAMDFGSDKKLILAATLLEFHKVDPEFHQQLVDSHQAGQGTVTEIIRREQVVSEDEIKQVTQAMVEVFLCRCFGTPHQELNFDENDNLDSFDFDTTAVRLRIDTGVLLKTVTVRVAEIEKVMAEVNGGTAVFALAESSDSAQLTESEKEVLYFVDGRKTVEEIAVAFRESTLNLARQMSALATKRVIQRATTGSSPATVERIKQTMATLPPVQVSSIVPSPQLPPPRRSNLALVVVGGVVLLVMVAVAILVFRGHGQQEAFKEIADKIESNLAQGRWNLVIPQLDEAKAAAGNDLVANQRVTEFEARLAKAIDQERLAIKKFIETTEFGEAHNHIALIPPGEAIKLRQELVVAEAAFKQRSETVDQQVKELLDNGKIKEAVALIGQAKGRDGEVAANSLERWRHTCLEQVQSPTLALSRRLALVDQVLEANPTSRQKEQIERIQGDIAKAQAKAQKHVAEDIQKLRVLVEQGAFNEALAEWARLDLVEQVRGTPLMAEVESLRQGIEREKAELTKLEAEALSVAQDADEAITLADVITRIQEVQTRLPQASNAGVLRVAAQVLGEIKALGEKTVVEEAGVLDGWIKNRQLSPELVKALIGRTERLRTVEQIAAKALERVHALTNQNELEEAQRLLEDIVGRKEWLHTEVYALAARELKDISLQASHRQALLDALKQAIAKRDFDEVEKIAVQIPNFKLPMLIDSQPAGAEVWRKDQKLGLTLLYPLDIPQAERGALTLELRKPGYVVKTVSGDDVVRGWRILAQLERQSVEKLELGMTVTARPVVLGGKLWLANRQLVVAYAPGSKPERFEVEPGGDNDIGGTRQPLYAAPTLAEDGVYLTTRERLAIRIGKGGSIERMPLGERTDLPVLVHNSQNIVGRKFLIVSGQDGALHAVDDRDPNIKWTGAKGAPFVTSPCLVGEQVLVVRQDGRCEAYLADDGKPAGRFELKAPVLAAWPTAAGLAGMTGVTSWTWNGQEPVQEALPQEALNGGEDVFFTVDNHVWLRKEPGGWQDLGRVMVRPTGTPLRWHDHAVLPCGKSLVVVGPNGFIVNASVDFLNPVCLGEQLAAVTLNGQVWIFAP